MAIKNSKSIPPRQAPKSKPVAATPVPPAKVETPVVTAPVPAVPKAAAAKPVTPPVTASEPKPAPLKPVVEASARAVETAKATAENVAAPVALAAKTVVEAAARTVTETAKVVTAAAAKTSQSAQKEIKPMTDVKSATDNFTANAQSAFGDVNDRAKAAFEKNARIVEEMNDFAKGNLEAFVESGRIAAKGVESLGQDAAEYGRKSFEHATAALKSFSSVKSPTELFKLQSDFFRGAFDAYVAEASKTTEQVLKLAGDAVQPLSNRVAVAAEKVKTVA